MTPAERRVRREHVAAMRERAGLPAIGVPDDVPARPAVIGR